jgi:hypothetical protein
MGSRFFPVKDFPGYEIDKAGVVRHVGGKELTVHTSSGRKDFVSLRFGKKYRHRSINVLLRETFGHGAATAAGYEEPDMKRVQIQRDLAKRPRSGKSLGQDAYVGPTRECHDCGKPTNNYRCDECWRKVRGFGMDGAVEYHTDLYGV